MSVATALTACGIETLQKMFHQYHLEYQLQQRLPLAVLKQPNVTDFLFLVIELQQRLPLAVLKHTLTLFSRCWEGFVATALTACGIETIINTQPWLLWISCNSAYRLRY